MTQGIISNDKSGDTNLTDTNCHWYSKVFLPLTFLFIIIKILLDEATMNLWPTGRPPMPLLVMRLGELGRLTKLTGGLRWLSWWLWQWPMVIDHGQTMISWIRRMVGWRWPTTLTRTTGFYLPPTALTSVQCHIFLVHPLSLLPHNIYLLLIFIRARRRPTCFHLFSPPPLILQALRCCRWRERLHLCDGWSLQQVQGIPVQSEWSKWT